MEVLDARIMIQIKITLEQLRFRLKSWLDAFLRTFFSGVVDNNIIDYYLTCSTLRDVVDSD